MNPMAWAFKLATHPKAVQEFRIGLVAIQPIMTDPKESREKKRETLNMMVNELSENTFKLKPIIEQIMTIINMKEEVCKEYPDSETQTDGILSWLPRMKIYRLMLIAEVKRNRKSYGLRL